MLTGAADTSGNDKHVSFVIGTCDSIKNIHGKLGFDRIHMRKLEMSEKEQVINRMKIKGDILVACFNINRHEIINGVQNKLKNRILKKGFLEQCFNDILRSQLGSVYGSFLSRYNTNLQSVSFECDVDMRRTLSSVGFQCKDPSLAHDLADVTSYCNNKGKPLKKVIDKDITKHLQKQLRIKCGI